MNLLSFSAETEDEGKRLDALLAERFPEQSRSYLRKLIEEGRVKRNSTDSVKASQRIRSGDVVELDLPDPEPIDAKPEPMDLDIVYEDADLLIVNKPKGLSVHPGAGHPDHTLVNGLLAHCGTSLSGINGALRPGIVHRIDMDTSGLLIVCKNDAAHRSIASQLEVHSIKRIYYGITVGTPDPPSGTVNKPIGRNPNDRIKMAAGVPNGKRAVTHYQTEEFFSGYAFCSFRLETGRTHQIRVHMASIGHPLLGDTVYGAKKQKFQTQGQVLHAAVIGFRHPSSGEYMEFCAPLPNYFNELLHILRNLS